jgi:hypothetical protein
MDALYYADYTIQNDFAVAGLLNLGYNVTVASSWSDFDTKLASGAYGLAVAYNQGDFGLPSGSILQSYINGGGCVIFCDWSRNSGLASIFEASYSGVDNQSPMNVLNAGIASGITNPVVLTNPGWAYIFSVGLSATGGGQVLATFPNGNAAMVQGNGGKTIILGYLSDTPPAGDRQKLFENVVGATLCGGQEVPISDWAIYLGIFLILSFVVVRYVKAS